MLQSEIKKFNRDNNRELSININRLVKKVSRNRREQLHGDTQPEVTRDKPRDVDNKDNKKTSVNTSGDKPRATHNAFVQP